MVLFCTREAKMSSRILGVLLSPLSDWLKKRERTKTEVGALFCCLDLQTLKKIFATFKIFHLSSQLCRETKICRTFLFRNSPPLNANAISDTLSTAFWHNNFTLIYISAVLQKTMKYSTIRTFFISRTEMQFHQGTLKHSILPYHFEVISVRANKAQEHLKWNSLQMRYEKQSPTMESFSLHL